MLPSAIWRTAVGLGINLGWSADQLDRQAIPGAGTLYVIGLSVLSLGGAGLTLRLVTPNGDRLPEWAPMFGGRRLPRAALVAASLTGVAVVSWITAMTARNWHRVNGFADQPGNRWALLMAACYAPAILWGPLLLAVTADFAKRDDPRHTRAHRQPPIHPHPGR